MSTTSSEKAKAGLELRRVIETLTREKGIPEEVSYNAIERAVRLAIGKHFGDDDDILVSIDHKSGMITAQKGDVIIDPHAGSLGRIAAQAAKQQMIQLFREEESSSLMADMERMKGQLLHQPGIVSRIEGGAAIVTLAKTEAILPRGEQIPGETHHVGEKIRAVVLEVKKAGNRVKVILSRTNPLFVQRLFEREIPEIEDRTIKIERVAREAGYRTKVAVSSVDSRVDCVGACVGVRGTRIKNIVEELGGVERIDIVRWNDSLQLLIQNALQPATIDEVFLYDKLQRAIVLVKEDQLSLAIGRRGQNVRLASKLVDWDIEIMTPDELNTAIDKAESEFMALDGMPADLMVALIEAGFLSCEDVAVLTPAELIELGAPEEDTGADLIAYADEAASQAPAGPKGGKGRDSGRGAGQSSARTKFDNLFTAPEEGAATGEGVPPQEGAEVQAADPTQEQMLEEVVALEHTLEEVHPQEEMEVEAASQEIALEEAVPQEEVLEHTEHPAEGHTESTHEQAPKAEHGAGE